MMSGWLTLSCYTTLCQAHPFPCRRHLRRERTPLWPGGMFSSIYCSVRVVPGSRVCPRRGSAEHPPRPVSLRSGSTVCGLPHRCKPPLQGESVTAVRAESAGQGVPAASAARAAAPKAGPLAVDGYTARHLSVLEGLKAVRKRPGMYIGSTDGRGLMHCLWEIFDNAVDEALGGHCTSIDVVLHPDMSAEVRDNGRGIPVDVEPKSGMTGVELVMTRLHAGGKFGGGSYTASGGLHGVGASVVNALAARLDVEVDREGHTWAASFRRGVTGEFAGPGPDADFTRKSGLRQLSRPGQASRVRRATGTRIRFWPDRQVFIKDARFSFDALTERARQTAYLVPGLTISIREEPSGSPDGTQADHERVKQAVFRF